MYSEKNTTLTMPKSSLARRIGIPLTATPFVLGTRRKTLKTQENKTERRHDKARECARRTPFSYSIFVGLVLCDGVQIRLNIAV